MKTQLIIFGNGKIAEAATYYFNRDSNYEITAYVADEEFIKSDTFLEKPLVKLSAVEKLYPCSKYHAFVAVGYQGINQFRKSKYTYFKEAGYTLASYVSPFVQGDFTLGENSIIMDGAVIQPCASFGNDVFVWGGAMIGHHAIMQDHTWLTGGCMIGGAATIEEGSFVGLGAVIGNEVVIGKQCMIGASTFTTRSVKEKTVLMTNPTEPHRLNSDQFTRMSSCFRV